MGQLKKLQNNCKIALKYFQGDFEKFKKKIRIKKRIFSDSFLLFKKLLKPIDSVAEKFPQLDNDNFIFLYFTGYLEQKIMKLQKNVKWGDIDNFLYIF